MCTEPPLWFSEGFSFFERIQLETAIGVLVSLLSASSPSELCLEDVKFLQIL